MCSRIISSRASADLPPGTLIAGFRVERVLGHGSQATVYEATQLALDRRVALKLMHDRGLADRVRRLDWPEHPGAVSLFGTGDSEHGPWLAMRLVAGETLATRWAPLDQVAAALAQAHAAGIVHGHVSAGNVLVANGRAYVTDFGLADGDATAADDDAALAQLLREHPPARSRRSLRPRTPQPSSESRRSSTSTRSRWPRRRNAIALGAAALAAAAAVIVAAGIVGGGDSGDSPGRAAAALAAPPVAAGATAIGSDLAAGAAETVDCSGSVPSGASGACSVSQRTLAGRAIVVPFDGTITTWAVRGARGSIALQVLRERDGQLIAADRTGDELVAGPAPHVFRTDLAVAAGDRVAVELTPGAAIGIRRRAAGTSTDRWFGPLRDIPLPPDEAAGSGFDHELLLRIDVSRDARIAATAPLRGRAAADAWPGIVVATREVAVRDGGALRTVRVVSLGSSVGIDVFDGPRRIARTPVPGADGRGRLRRLTPEQGTIRLHWQNPDGQRLDRRFAITATGAG